MLVNTRIAHVLSEAVTACPRWPPDLFAVCSALLRESGAYERVVALGPSPLLGDDWPSQSRTVAARWREALEQRPTAKGAAREPSDLPAPPDHVLELWDTVIASTLQIKDLALGPRVVSGALVKLLTIADETCVAFGIRANSSLLTWAQSRLEDNDFRSLCWAVDVAAACVLPKQHTPQRGMTLRSLSHHLAYLPPTGVAARWHPPHQTIEHELSRLELLNILVLPWPEHIHRSAFRLVSAHDGPHPPRTGRFRFFEYTPAMMPDISQRVKRAIARAETMACDVDIVVMPELAIRKEQLNEVLDVCRSSRCAFVGGVGSTRAPPSARGADQPGGPDNLAVFDWTGWHPPVDDRQALGPHLAEQRKHHRWCLDAPQIRQYGLQGWLPEACDCWEMTRIGRREVSFLTMERWLTVTTLICEDLARQDPVADVVRAVGPNLVIGLLMDGSQISQRWSARYATILAEDPGSSVLTVTSLGMAALSRDHALAQGLTDRSRAVALWRDYSGRDTVIELPEGCNAALLHVVCKTAQEWSADGRGDGGCAYFPRLSSWTPIRV